MPILKFLQNNPQNNCLNFLTSKSIFITLQYSEDILGTFWKKTFGECSSNILETLQFVITGICQNINICYYQNIQF